MKWTVTQQTPTVLPGPSGQAQRGYNIRVETDTGHTDTVFVPESEYTPDGAKAIIAAHLGNVAAIGGLTGEV